MRAAVIEVGWRARKLPATHQEFGSPWWIFIRLDLAMDRACAQCVRTSRWLCAADGAIFLG